MRVVWNVLGFVLIFSVILFVATATVVYVITPEMSDNLRSTLAQLSAYSFFVFVFFLQTLAIVVLVYFVVLWVGRLLAFALAPSEKSGRMRPSLLAATLATGVVAILFSNTLVQLFEVALAVIRYLFGTLPRDILDEASRVITCVSFEVDDQGAGSPIEICIQELFLTERALAPTAVGTLTDGTGLSSINLPQLLIATVIFAGVLRLVDYLAATTTRKQKFWVSYGLVAIVAIYLALSATLSVSLLVETRDTDLRLSSEALGDAIQGLSPRLIANDFSATRNTRPLPNTGGLRAGQVDYANVRRELALDSADTAERLVRDAEVFAVKIESEAERNYRIVLSGDFASREQSLYFQNLMGWAADSFQAYVARVDTCVSANRANLKAFQIVKDLIAQGAALESRNGDGRAQDQLTTRYFQTEAQFKPGDTLSTSCQTPLNPIPVPRARNVGAALGVVGQATGWLLGTQSLQLTLVVGLVGFGLLGTLISRFVAAREGAFKIDDEIEFAVISLAGFVAALVVFVGSFGGMYVLSADKADPNPYVVFALCLGGSVFSGRVWNNLKERLEIVAKGGDDQNDSGGARPGPAPKPKPKPPAKPKADPEGGKG